MANISEPIKVNALDAFGGITVNVRVFNVWRLRLGAWLIKIAARVLDSPITFTHANEAGADKDK